MYRRDYRFDIVAGTDANDLVYWLNNTGKKLRIVLDTVKLVPNVSVSQHAANVILVELKNGSTVLCDYDTTTTTGDGALTAGTPVSMTAAATGVGTALEVASGSCLNVAVTKGGTGPAYEGYVSFQAVEVA